MRHRQSAITITCVFAIGVVALWAQARKSGLWEVTSTTTLQQSPFPPGMTPPADSPLARGPHTTQICLTQAMIDRFGGPIPQNGDCQFSDLKRDEHGMKATLVCSGRMVGNGSYEATWLDPEHAKSKAHFTGTVQGRSGPRTIEWTRESTSVFKSADCGDIKPLPLPEVK